MITETYTTKSGEKKEAFYGCEHCEGIIRRVGEDLLDVCIDCGQIEGNNKYYDCETNEVVEI